ncbi:hypothetical protein FB45DRAFT_1011502 [Roridomyces roridus]|uniref:Uncharacterized protein n=1 Tax=Roridomyces roridus TaxID=1738132 RepID=A0AAD7B0N2_9AGAR|nr:hypothetical protein FB45DRAFT_1011502 [Roridomyces roridus]
MWLLSEVVQHSNERLKDRSSCNDWLSNLQLLVAAFKSASSCIPVPCLPAIFEAVSAVLDVVEKVGKNDTDLKYLAESAVNIAKLLSEELQAYSDTPDFRLLALCNEFISYLEKVQIELPKRKSKLWFKKYLKAKSTRDVVDDFIRRLSDLRSDLTLAAAVGSRFQLVSTDRRVQEIQAILAEKESVSHLEDIEEDVSPSGFKRQLTTKCLQILSFKPSELYLDFESAHTSIVTLGKSTESVVKVRMCATKVGASKGFTARVYHGEHASQMWRRDLEMFSAHFRMQGIAQIYGMCKSPRLQALIFHDELVPIDMYASSLTSPARNVNFELELILHFTSVFSHISATLAVADTDYRETVADLALISRSNGSLVISHLPYPTDTGDADTCTEKQFGGPVHTWFSSCGCLANVGPGWQKIKGAEHLLSSTTPVFAFCETMGILSRYRSLSFKDEFPRGFKLGSIYLRRPDEREVVATIAEIPIFDPEIIVEDWATFAGASAEELNEGITRFTVALKSDSTEPGYFLSIYSSVYTSVLERETRRAGWLAQAHSVLSHSDVFEKGWGYQDMLIAELFFVNLDCELAPADLNSDEIDLDKLPHEIYIFVENLPVDNQGRISQPTVFWSTDPDRIATDGIPGQFRWEASFSAHGSGRAWERHHYDAVRAVQEKASVEPSTLSGFTLPRYEVSSFDAPTK